MKNQPIFSIIIPTFNRAAFVSKAIQSVLAQSFCDWELIVVDDGSTDNTREVVLGFNDSRIKYIYQENAERSAARNNGIKNAKGEYIVFLDSDDELANDILLNLYNFKKLLKGLSLIFFVVFQQTGINQKIAFNCLPESDNVVKYIFQNKLVVQVSQAAIPREFLINNLFEEKFSLWEDTHLYLRILAQYPYTCLAKKGVILQKHPLSTVSQGFSNIRYSDLERYLNAIDDIESSYSELFSNLVSKNDFNNYKDAKINMYLYQARVNRQFRVAYRIGWLLLRNNLTLKNIFTFSKLPFHLTISKVGFPK